MGLFSKLFGSHSDRELKKLYPMVDAIEALDGEYTKLTDRELRAKTDEFKNRLANGETLDDILVEAFAAVREAAWRVLGMKPFRVQLIGGIVLHQGRISEMKTGEGKTLVSVLPAYLNALSGEGVHIVTVNDYLARRDSEWMGKIHRFMGLTVGLIAHGLTPDERRRSYACDVTYGTNNELGFDYLRDNMAIYKSQMVQRGHNFAVVDEVDSILIDEARTPLIISGKGETSSELYVKVDGFVRKLSRKVYATIDEKTNDHEVLDVGFVVDEKGKSASLTEKGIAAAEKHFGVENLADIDNATLYHHINQALKAHGTMKSDIDYVVRDGEIVIVDEFTGRLMAGRRYSEGLHQAIEAKEGVKVEHESKTLATITFQNFFRLYKKLSGMTGTAVTEAEEFGAIYRLDIVEVPTNRTKARVDHPDVIYKNEAGKNRAIINQIVECHKKGQPILVGTVSIEKSEYVSSLLKKQGVPHNVLNAKNHEKEAEIVAQAGKLGAVTIATNMAGRGTDIMLGGNAEYLSKHELKKAGFHDGIIAEATGYSDTDNEDIIKAREMFTAAMAKHKAVIEEEAKKVREIGGLFILGTERHESRRIDNQLRGRAGRQGDPGESKFFLAMTDDIMRLFGSERVMGMMDSLGLDEDTPLEYKMTTNAIEQSQKTVESRHFQSRKSVLEYDDVMNSQRNIIYGQRKRVLDGEDVQPYVKSMINDFIAGHLSDGFGSATTMENEGDLEEVLAIFRPLFLPQEAINLEKYQLSELTLDKVTEICLEYANKVYEIREKGFGDDPTGKPVMRELERVIVLGVVDQYWMEHIDAMGELRRGIGLRAFGNTKPIDAYKREGFDMFDAMIEGIKVEVSRRIFTVQIKRNEQVQRKQVVKESVANVGGEVAKKKPVRKVIKVGVNDPCPCGSGQKFKKCCMNKVLQQQALQFQQQQLQKNQQQQKNQK